MEVPIVAIIYRLEIAGHHYVGSTTSGMTNRMRHHREAYEEGDERKLYAFIRDNGGWEEVAVSILHHWVISGGPTRGHPEVLAKENEFINLEDTRCLNSVKAKFSAEEYRVTHKDRDNSNRRERYHALKAADPEAHEKFLAAQREAGRAYRARKKAAAASPDIPAATD